MSNIAMRDFECSTQFITEQMKLLYLRFTQPYIILDIETGEILHEIEWTSESAKKLYEYHLQIYQEAYMKYVESFKRLQEI
jgi:hypothetical protein